MIADSEHGFNLEMKWHDYAVNVALALVVAR
jgi:hypothetical protein